LAVVLLDGLLVGLQEVEDLVELQQKVEQALKLLLPLCLRIHLQHFLLL
jgi:hypothetical protein